MWENQPPKKLKGESLPIRAKGWASRELASRWMKPSPKKATSGTSSKISSLPTSASSSRRRSKDLRWMGPQKARTLASTNQFQKRQMHNTMFSPVLSHHCGYDFKHPPWHGLRTLAAEYIFQKTKIWLLSGKYPKYLEIWSKAKRFLRRLSFGFTPLRPSSKRLVFGIVLQKGLQILEKLKICSDKYLLWRKYFIN